ncbi:sulfotransferase family 2 domain-containing protein [Hyphococcus sp.]|uniref:sulfotransferase family 2 domain-containing protein n=1 Tax=Hyphococcus sp. TaxID=2038636 RepID=UPI0020839C73|nr:MAG: hypothetical protein DHS20C04_26520 [Marinicaulis sp.]
MIICHYRKFIFIHVPKAAGSTIKNYLRGFLKLGDLNLQLAGADVNVAAAKVGGAPAYAQFIRAEYGVHKHSTAPDIQKKLSADYFDTFFSFAFVRNPYSRAYSAYRFTLKWDEKLRPNSERYLDIKDMDFLEWLKSQYVQDYKMLQTKPQTHWIPDPGFVSYLGRTENFSTSMRDILLKVSGNAEEAEKLVSQFADLRNNQSTQQDEWKSISGEAADLIYKHYREDFEQFDYPRQID